MYKKMIFKNAELDFTKNKIYIMGILNVTPDSFSDGGNYLSLDKALFRAEEMTKEGADIIDIGGESTRPFSDSVPESEELERVVPVVEAVAKRIKTIISIDTYKSRVADEALRAGAEIINDISGFSFDHDMIKTAKTHNAKCIVMHIKGEPKNMQVDPKYHNVVSEVYDFLKTQTDKLLENGVKDIIIDPGFGFGKSLNDNYIILKNLNGSIEMGFPVLAGVSRKSMIGKVVESKPAERVSGTVALNTIAALNGARLVRVHDVAENFQAMKVVEKYLEDIK
jgi:dihydropteroate synthase